VRAIIKGMPLIWSKGGVDVIRIYERFVSLEQPRQYFRVLHAASGLGTKVDTILFMKLIPLLGKAPLP
jgi:hypothetical protein